MLAASTSTLFEFKVEQCGEYIWPIFQNCKRGHITAVFDNSFYIEIDSDLACIVQPTTSPSAINLITRTARCINWHASGLQTGSNVNLTCDGFVVARQFHFQMTDTRIWRPPSPTENWTNTTLREGLECWQDLTRRRAPATGLSRLVFQDDLQSIPAAQSQVACNAATSIRSALMTSLENPLDASASNFDCARTLLGMGPGLTPSGDDFIGGLMIALHVTGNAKISDKLWQSVQPAAIDRTNSIALAHLRGASQGTGSDAVHRLLNAILEGDCDKIHELISDIDQIGHSSGWDIVAGAVCVLQSISDNSAQS